MEKIIEQILDNFNFAFMLTVNILTYIIIKGIDAANGDKKVSTNCKRIVLLVSTIIVVVSYILGGYTDYIILINSTILAPIAWSWVFKPIAKKVGVDYKKVDDTE